MITLLAAVTVGQYTTQISIGFARGTAVAPPLPLTEKFKISIMNGTKNTVNLPADTCSWGHNMVSFEVKDPGGHIYLVKHKKAGFGKNILQPLTLESVGIHVREINLSDGTWQGIPTGATDKPEGWQIKVKLTVDKERRFTEKGYWTGSIASGFTPARW